MHVKCILLIVVTCLTPAFGQSQIQFELNTDRVHDLEIKTEGDTYAMRTTGRDPWVYTLSLKQQRPEDAQVLSFEYFCAKGLDHLQIFFCDPASESRSKTIQRVGLSEGWVSTAVDLSDVIELWGKVGDRLRLDLGRRANVNVQIRNLRLRSLTVREREIAATREAKKTQERILEAHLKDYLATSFASQVSHVQVEANRIVIKGLAVTTDRVWLAEIPPYAADDLMHKC